MLEAKAKDQGNNCKCFPKKKVLKSFFLSISKKKRSIKTFFSRSTKNSAVLEPRTANLEDLRLRGQGLENVSLASKMCPWPSSKPKWGAQAVARGGMAPLTPPPVTTALIVAICHISL